MEKKILIFDFDGTIADTKALFYDAIYHILKKFGFSYKSVSKFIDLGLTLKYGLKKLGFSKAHTWFIEKKIMKKAKTNIKDIEKCMDVNSIKKIETNKIVVSNSSRDFIVPILKHFKLKKYFQGVYGAEDFLKKEEFIEDYLDKNRIDKRNCYYIGDRVSDIKVAKKVGCNSIIIAGKCAWDDKEDIIKHEPDIVVTNIKDLNRIFK